MEILSTPSESEKTYAMLIHILLPFFFVVPIILWLLRRDESGFIDQNGKIVVNWVISFAIYGIIGFFLCLLLIGFVLLWALGICSVIFAIVGAIKAFKGEVWNYPLNIQFFK